MCRRRSACAHPSRLRPLVMRIVCRFCYVASCVLHVPPQICAHSSFPAAASHHFPCMQTLLCCLMCTACAAADLRALILPEFFHWLKHTPTGQAARLAPTPANTVLTPDPTDTRLQLLTTTSDIPATHGAVVPPLDEQGWSLYDVQVTSFFVLSCACDACVCMWRLYDACTYVHALVYVHVRVCESHVLYDVCVCALCMWYRFSCLLKMCWKLWGRWQTRLLCT